EAPQRIDVGRVADRPGYPENEVVARLVGKQQRAGLGEKLRCIFQPLGVHHSSSSTSTAPPATRSPSPTWTARTVASYGETSGVSIFIASSTTSGCRAATDAPGSTRTRITVPGIGATTSDCSRPPAPCAPAALSTAGRGWDGGAGRLSRHGSLQTSAGAAAGGSERGGFSVRNA